MLRFSLRHSIPCYFGLICVALLGSETILAEEPNPAVESDAVLAGHSIHGEAFNEGPRQQAYLIPGTGKISFEVQSENEQVRKFVEQGIGQLHGFWFFEAERSFRQAAMIDPNCAIAYWGMARANENNEDRAKQLIEKALTMIDHASPREQRYITSLHEFLTAEGKKKEKEAKYVEAVEELVKEFPDDLEAKALLGYVLYKYRDAADRTHAEVDVVLDQVLGKEKAHPVHHYRIHIWDQKSPQRALDSAAKCGPAAEGIAHMWHMCGHIFSRVKRYGDAAWFQEASARVDHRHMMHAPVIPDQTHNFAHNNEWLIRNLMHVGRVRDAVELAKNMIELPRHPTYNTLKDRHSAWYGRERLLNVLDRYELWEELIELADGPYLEPTDDIESDAKRLHFLGKAHAKLGQIVVAQGIVEELGLKLAELEAQKPADVEDASEKEEAESANDAEASAQAQTDKESREQKDEAEYLAEQSDAQVKDEKVTDEKVTDEKVTDEKVTDEKAAADEKSTDEKDEDPEDEEAKKAREEREKKEEDRKKRVEQVEHAIACIEAHMAVDRGDYEEALRLLEKAEEDKLSIARVRLLLGDHEKAVSDASNYQKDRKKQVQPLAGLVEVCWQANERGKAAKAFVRLRACSRDIQLTSPQFERLAPIAKELGYPADWRVAFPDADDLGKRPPLDALGPFRWTPAPAREWILPDSSGELHSLRAYRGRPVIVVFYLGYGCLHCAEQLQAIAPRTQEFEEAGISLVAISTDTVRDLAISHENYEEGKFPFPLIANSKMDIFKAYRAYDDFEDQPLHGTYLIDEQGRIRWQDISYEPFMDVDFLLNESQRLLKQRTVQKSPGEFVAK